MQRTSDRPKKILKFLLWSGHEQIVDVTGLVNPQFSSTAVEASAPQVVVSLPPFERVY